MSCFPSSLTWLVRQLKTGLSDQHRISVEEAELICTDLLFTFFLCPAILKPGAHGIISDTPISQIARINLTQVGRIIQSLALLPYEDPPAHMNDILSKINQQTMPQVIRTILGRDVLSLDTMFPGIVVDGDERELYSRSACFGSLAEIQTLLEYLRSSASDAINDESHRKSIKSLIRRIPEDFSNMASYSAQHDDSTPKTASIPRSSSGRLRTFVDRVQNAAKTHQQRLISNLPSSPSNSDLERSMPSSPVSSMVMHQNHQQQFEVPQVLIFTLDDGHVPLGLESEEKIMSAVRPTRKHTASDSLAEKKTRFKATESVVSDHTYDTGTTDAPSDDDAEEEGAESICSSINDNLEENAEIDGEEDTLPDNFSDTIPTSANVSVGRGSPSLSGGRNSGRGTPFSGSVEGQEPSVSVSSTVADAAGAAQNESHRNLPRLPVTIRKQNPEGLEEKFGKFGLPPNNNFINRDETYSLVSDSWSTDVVASDNEGLADQQQQQHQQITPPIPPRLDQPPPLPNLPVHNYPHQQQLTPPHQAHHPILHESLSAGRINDLISMGGGSSGAAGIPSFNNSGHATGFALSPGFSPLSSVDRDRIADNILDKYRTMPANLPSATNSLANGRSSSNNEPAPGSSKNGLEPDSTMPYYDPTNITQCRAFLDAKRKLRLVLSSAANIPTNTTVHSAGNTLIGGLGMSNVQRMGSTENDLRTSLNEFLKLLLAESINSQDKTLSAQIREAQRCLAVFDQKGIRKLLRTLKDEHRRRSSSYLMYLQQSRLTLLQLNSYFNKLAGRVAREKSLTEECLIEVLVGFSIMWKENYLKKFVYGFQRSRAQDERTYLVDRTLNELYGQLQVDPIWQCLSEENVEYVRKSMERSLMAQIYKNALYPNGEADLCRDEVFHKSLKSVAAYITLDHPELRIPKRFHAEAPWPAAQSELLIINAYKSPRDKLGCILRCCETIENLIILASNQSVSADDITPVLVYVVLQANPPVLLSNIQFIESFYGSRMQAEEQYWWTQFRAAVEFLKTLCNNHLSPGSS